jgi:hypothetical protein
MYLINNELMRNELINDYVILGEYPDMKTKKALAEKYGIESKKVKEIQNCVLIALRNERKTRTTFDEVDFRYFVKFDIPETYAKAVPFYKEESIDFLNYVMGHFWSRIVERKLDKKLSLVNTKGYGVCAADKYLMRRYLNITKYLEETKPENVEKKRNDEEINNVIRNILLKDMVAFHDAYIAKVTKWANMQYPKIIEIKNETREQLDKLPKDVKYNVWRPLKNKYDRAVALLTRFDTIEKYVEWNVENAENQYMSDINSVVERIRKRELDYDNLKVINVYDDPKFFEMTITDGKQSLYARSIWAAEYSEKVTAHYRFIIS